MTRHRLHGAALFGRCTVCGHRVWTGGPCPATEDEDPTDEIELRMVQGPMLVCAPPQRTK